MPTITSTLGVSLTNWGALTTTFTPPASCQTAADFVAFIDRRTPDVLEWSETCDWEVDNCLPAPVNPGQLEGEGEEENISTAYLQTYYSPGSICPSGWKTIGLAARAGQGPLNTQGVFATVSLSEEEAESEPTPGVLNPYDILALALDPSETAIACCPSSMDAAPGWGCTSELPSYPISTGCAHLVLEDSLDTITTTITQGAATITGVLLSVTGSPEITTSVTTFEPEVAAGYVAVSRMPMVLMVHRDDVETDSKQDTSTSERTRLLAATDPVGGQVTWMLGGLAAGVMVGVALLAPWLEMRRLIF